MYTVEQLAKHLNGVWHGDAEHAILGLSSLARATHQDIAFFDNNALRVLLEKTRAGVVLLKEESLPYCPVNAIVVADPVLAIQAIAELMPEKHSFAAGIHPTAQIHPSACLGKNITIGAYAVVEEGVSLGDGVVVGSHVAIGSAVQVGANSRIDNHSVVYPDVLLGKNVRLYSGAVIGADPFNYSKQPGRWQQGLSRGGVVISDGTHIGANTVVDRGAIGDTYISQGVCIDNLVQIAHDVFLGDNTLIAGCAAIGAHAVIGADCIIGGGSCIAAFVHLVADVVVSGMSTVNKSIAKPGIYSSGTLAHEHQRWRKNAARFRRLDDYIAKLGSLERRIECLHNE